MPGSSDELTVRPRRRQVTLCSGSTPESDRIAFGRCRKSRVLLHDWADEDDGGVLDVHELAVVVVEEEFFSRLAIVVDDAQEAEPLAGPIVEEFDRAVLEVAHELIQSRVGFGSSVEGQWAR